MIQIEYLPIVLTGIGIMASILYYASVLRNANKTQKMQLDTRQAQLFMQIYSVFASDEFFERAGIVVRTEFTDLDDFWENHYTSQHWTHWTWLNGLGILLKNGLVDLEMVYDMLGGFGPPRVWSKYRDVILDLRDRHQLPDMFSSFEYLAGEITRVMEERGMPSKWSWENDRFEM